MGRKVCLLKRNPRFTLHLIPRVLQIVLNTSLVFLGIILSFLLVKELIMFSQLLMTSDNSNHKTFLESILIFFLYFEFITMIVKYFEEEYHFPLRYFIYIGITAMIRLIIVDHKDPMTTLLYSLIILILIIGYFIMNLTPRERPESRWFFTRKQGDRNG
jgi:protein PsiE